MAEIIVNAKDSIVGRFGTFAAKRALRGDEIKIVNCEKAIITGSKAEIFKKFHKLRKYMGKPVKGPFVSRLPDRFVRRMIRGMLPYKQERGKNAFARIMCYTGIPEELKDKKIIQVEKSNISKVKIIKYITIQDLCRKLGGKI